MERWLRTGGRHAANATGVAIAVGGAAADSAARSSEHRRELCERRTGDTARSAVGDRELRREGVRRGVEARRAGRGGTGGRPGGVSEPYACARRPRGPVRRRRVAGDAGAG